MFGLKFNKRSATGLAGASIIALTVGGGALADSLFVRDRNISVLERSRPGFEAPGLRAGQFIIRPKLDVGVGYNSNVFAVSDVDASAGLDGLEDESDVFVFARPSLVVESDWNRHALSLGAYTEAAWFAEYDSEAAVDGGVFLDGRLDVARMTSISAGASYDRLNESRRGYNTSFLFQEPIDYSLTQAYLGFQQEINRVRFSLQGDFADYNYEDATPVTGATGSGLFFNADQDFRDRQSYSVLGEVGFAVTRDAAIYFSGEYNWQDFDAPDAVFTRNRDSSGYRLTAGTEFDLSKLVRGRLGVGYFEQEFDDSSFENIDGVAFEAALEWFPTEMTTVSLNANRDVSQSSIVFTGGYVSSDIILQIDQELRRNMIASAFVGVGRDEYDDPILDVNGAPVLDGNGNPISQEVDRIGAGVSGQYFFSPYLSAGLEYTYEKQDVELDIFNDGFDTNYGIHQVLLTFSVER